MIRVRILKNGDEIKGFKVEGHALFDDPGKDIVCAAVSILTINTVNAIETFVKGQKTKILSDRDNGIIECRFSGGMRDETKLLVDTYMLGIKGIEDEYGREYVRLEEES